MLTMTSSKGGTLTVPSHITYEPFKILRQLSNIYYRYFQFLASNKSMQAIFLYRNFAIFFNI